MASTASSTTQVPVTVSLADLESGSISLSSLEEAFGPSSLGIIVVKDLPAHFADLRTRLLSYSSYLAKLPQAELDKLESSEGKYLTGWSLGRESLKPGLPDTLKGSYYINCSFHVDRALACAPSQSPSGKDYSKFTEYTTPNLWPDEHATHLHGFRETSEALIELIINTAALVARACDKFANAHVEGYSQLAASSDGSAAEKDNASAANRGKAAGYLERVVRSSLTTKARLLHYFPPKSDAEGYSSEDDWCATHVDHGCLTGLTSAMYVDEAVHSPVPPFPLDSTSDSVSNSTSTSSATPQAPKQLPELSLPPGQKGGLYIHSRSNTVTRVSIPRDCLAFQTGLALEVATKGAFRAVPHFVQGGGMPGVARNTLAVFTQPNLWETVDVEGGIEFAGLARKVVEKNY